MPQVGDIWEAYRADEFVVIVAGAESPSVTKVSGLSEGEFDTIEQADGGSHHVFKVSSTKVKFESLTLERNMDGSADDALFRDWFKETFQLNADKPQGSAIRRNGMIEKRHNGETVVRFAFYNAWIKSSKFTDLEAGANSLFKQTIVLEHEGLERVD
jgi:phage tail-like protein